MKTNNFYTILVFSVWYFIKKASMAIVSAFPTQKIHSKRNRRSKIYIRDEESISRSEKHYHRPMSKPAVEKQTLLKETKKQKIYRP